MIEKVDQQLKRTEEDQKHLQRCLTEFSDYTGSFSDDDRPMDKKTTVAYFQKIIGGVARVESSHNDLKVTVDELRQDTNTLKRDVELIKQDQGNYNHTTPSVPKRKYPLYKTHQTKGKP